jgi:ankyrin repeat protein
MALFLRNNFLIFQRPLSNLRVRYFSAHINLSPSYSALFSNSKRNAFILQILNKPRSNTTIASSDLDDLVFPTICNAAKSGDDDTIDRILSISANSAHLTCKDLCRTPLHYAALNGHHKAILSYVPFAIPIPYNYFQMNCRLSESCLRSELIQMHWI